MSATHCRQCEGCKDSKNSKPTGNISKPEGKIREVFQVSSLYFDDVSHEMKWQINITGDKTLEAEVKIRDFEEITVAYIRNIGHYKGNEELFGSLFGKLAQWAGPRGLIWPPECKFLTLYHDSPEITDDDKQRISICISVPPETKVGGEIGKTTVPGGKQAVARFEINPDEYGQAWNAVYKGWLPTSGYQARRQPSLRTVPERPEDTPGKQTYHRNLCAG